MPLRSYQDSDQAAVIALWRAAGLLVNPLNDPAHDIAFCLDSGHGEILLLEEDGAITASVMVGHDGHRGWVYYLACAPDRQGQGLGRRMSQAAEHWLRERHIAKVQLLVRDSNKSAVGFYQRCGYMLEPSKLMSRRLDGVALDLAQQSNADDVVVTFLEMTEKPEFNQLPPKIANYMLLRAEPPTLGFYRYLYDAVGAPWYWTDRKKLSDDELRSIIEDAAVDIFVLHVAGAPAGFFELDRREENLVDLAYFGIMPDFIGQRLGPYMLNQALIEAWSDTPDKVTVNTCTLDHPSALPMYQRMGFQPVRTIQKPPPWRTMDHILDAF